VKFLHLSDLHIGKRVHEFSMIEDQRFILKQILKIVDQEKPEGIILAGDIYDKPVPPAEAVKVLDEFLTALAERGLQVFLISGNHDSPERLSFGAQLMGSRGVHMAPVYDGTVRKLEMEDDYGKVYVHLLPFIKPAVVRHVFAEESVQQEPEAGVVQPAADKEMVQPVSAESALQSVPREDEEPAARVKMSRSRIETYQDAVQEAVAHMDVDTAQRNVLVAHQFVTGAGRCESEELLVGGLDNIDASLFDEFDYVALGHIHSPQHIGRKTVRYCGTPLKYSFSEAGQVKSVTIVELREKNQVEVRTVPLVPLHDMRTIRGTYLEVTARSFYEDTDTEDYVQITLTDEEDVPDGMQKLRVIYPNLMRLEYDNCRTRENQEIAWAESVEKKSELELFEEFYQLQNNQIMSDVQREYVKKLILELKQA